MNILKSTSLVLLSYFITSSVFSRPNSPWTEVSSSTPLGLQQRVSFVKPSFISLQARTFSLDNDKLRGQLKKSSSELSSRASTIVDEQTLIIPLPNGDEIEVTAKENSVLSPGLAKKFPDMKSWTVQGKLDSRIHGRVDFSEHGFHAMLIMPNGDTVFVEPESRINTNNQYLSFSKSSNADHFKTGFQCSLHSNHADDNQSKHLINNTRTRLASSLITYRLAVAATGEYTQFHGGTKSSALSAIRTTINRVNEVYERDLGITFQLVDEELDLIYINPLSDPYSNSDGARLIDQNINNLTATGVLSRSKFDVGHVFSTGAGGIAVFESACSDPSKAGGATGFANPIGDVFSIDFVSHELGHQLGANHTFNSESGLCGGGTRVAESAVEPGSGSTIMAYAGICDENDLQPNTDAAFHALSIAEILRFTRNANQVGSFCGARTAVTNHDPIPNAGSDNTIPANTPFMLSGAGSDPNTGDVLSYSWEQNDKGTASDMNIDTGDNAIIRSFLPQSSATRYIPRLVDLFENQRLKAEKLPETDRDLNFVLTVRDGKGGIEFDNLFLNVIDTGRTFQVTSHSVPADLDVGQSTQVLWDVASTDSSPINCNAVDIGLIQSNGSRIEVLQNTANDGGEVVVIPSSASGITGARFVMNCSGNGNTFFNISDADLRIIALGSSSSSGGSSTGGSSSGGGNMDYLLILLLVLLSIFRVESLKVTRLKKQECHNEKS